jgi:hypothetical protein
MVRGTTLSAGFHLLGLSFRNRDIAKKVEYLLLFFEGFCEFLDTLIISAISSDKSFYQNTAKEWLTNEKERLWHERATFRELAKPLRGTEKKYQQIT